MKSDITRDTFSAAKHFSRVISQQGRVTLDADSNEQTAILLHYLRTLAADLIGPYAAPVMAPGFQLSPDDEQRLVISPGRYYVQGLLVENDYGYLYTNQPYHPLLDSDGFAKAIDDKKNTARYWVYLDAWERHITALEDDSIREKALGGPDTCTRAEVAWQVKALDVDKVAISERFKKRREWLEGKKKKLEASLLKAKTIAEKSKIEKQIKKIEHKQSLLEKEDNPCEIPLVELLPLSDALMGARVDPGSVIAAPCVTSPDSKYRGAENQLYRVEIHRGGFAGEATFKWSRDNASVATAWLGTSGNDLQVANARGFSAGNWVELTDDVAEFQGQPGMLVKLAKVEGGALSVDPDAVAASGSLAWSEGLKNPKVRRWDHFASEDTELLEDDGLEYGSILIQETPVGTPDADAVWLDLEDGIQIQFAEGGEYRSGDYWLIPARVATGNIEWPETEFDGTGNEWTAQIEPHGVLHYFAPLGFIGWDAEEMKIKSCYCDFEPLSSCFAGVSVAVGAHLVRPNNTIMFPESTAGTALGRSSGSNKPPARSTSKKASTKKPKQ